MFGELSRRDFLKSSAAVLAALSLSTWFPLPRRAAGQSCPPPATYGFNCLPSQLATGQPIADIAAGADGMLWAVDALGVPHFFDPLAQTWTAFGRGLDAATLIGAAFYLFQGAEVAIYDTTSQQVTVQLISALWPGLPPSFTRDLDGAFVNGETLYLCRSGRYVAANLSAAPVAFSAPSPLNAWPNWPAPNPWAQGVVGKVGSWIDNDLPAALVFPAQTAPDAFLAMFLIQGGSVNVTPIAQLAAFIPPAAPQIADMLAAGDFDAYITQTNGARIPNTHWVFQGPVVWTQVNGEQVTGPPTPLALASWVPAWFPALKQAPRGRMGSLWSVTTAGAVVYHDGTRWTEAPALGGATPLWVDVGEDGVPFAIATGAGGAALYQFDPATLAWQPPVALGAITPQQLAVGDASRVYVLSEQGAVSQLVNGSFVPLAALPSGVAHLAANHDGTLWHCDGTTPSAFRFISEQPYGKSLPIPNVTSIQQVASSAYGNALLLAEQEGTYQLYSYSSPAVFKTSPSYVPLTDGPMQQNAALAAGGGRCFVNLGTAIAALDSHTGAHLWQAAAPGGGSFAALTYDPLLRLLYATDDNVTLLALDAATGAQLWSFQVAAGPINEPVLSGSGLCVVGVGNFTVYWIDTKAALAAARSDPPQAVQAAWSTMALQPGGANAATVLIEENLLTLVFLLGDPQTGYNFLSVCLAAQDGTATGGEIGVTTTEQTIPVIGRAPWLGNRQTLALLNCGFGIWAFPAAVPPNTPDHLTNAPTGSGGLSAGLALHDGTLYAGGNNGMLYALAAPDGSAGFQPLLAAPVTGGAFAAGPVAAPDGRGGIALVFSGRQGSRNSIWIYDPLTADLVQIDTDQLLATQLVVDENGIVFAAGNPGASFGQVYAFRIDQVLQQERAFIVDSELMQDFDEPSAGSLTATARYQTHVTIVDARKTPRPFQAVKVWADTPLLSLVQIDGQPYFINATTAATVQTDAAGTLTIVSDAADLSATPLKLWAGFMNPYERIVVYPDRAFHARLATTEAAPNQPNPDPLQINLATATTYDVANLPSPPKLFAANEQPQASAAATAVQQLTSAVVYQSGATPGAARRRAAAPAPGRYLAYAGSVGAAYGPFDTPANRQVAPLLVAGVTGFQFGGGTTTLLAVSDAANAIDALAGAASGGEPSEPGSVLSWLRRLWDKIKSDAAVVVQIVISIGRELYLGLQYIENGVTKVLRQALRDVEDVAIAIGSVFVELGKDIVKVAEALSLIFHLGEVVATAKLLKGYFTNWAANLPQTIGQYTRQITQLLGTLESDIGSGLQSLIAYFDSGELAGAAGAAGLPISGMQGVGQTPHTAFAVTPQAGGAVRPAAVPAMWGAHKLRANLSQAPGAAPPGSGVPDFVAAFISSFATDPGLQAALSNARQQFHNSFHPASAKAFLGAAVGDLLSLIEVIAVAAVDGIKAGVNVVLNNLSAVAEAIGTWGNVEIPILSTLLRLLGLGDVTFLDILLLVAAIPVTLIYRIRYGTYPAAAAAGAAASVLGTVAGLMGGVVSIVNGILAAIVDADANETLTEAQSKVNTLLSVGGALLASASYVMGDVAAPTVWVILASVINILLALLGIWSPAADSPPSLAAVPSVFGALMATPLLLYAYVEQWEVAKDAVALTSGVVGAFALFVNPLKFSADLVVVAVVTDILAGFAGGYLTLIDTLADPPPPTDLPVTEEPSPLDAHRVFLPAIEQGR
jgi:outer membrane protein assembly factor BamB